MKTPYENAKERLTCRLIIMEEILVWLSASEITKEDALSLLSERVIMYRRMFTDAELKEIDNMVDI